ncbi:MAG: peptide MFS transporter [Phycisphaerae bacterium]
MSTRPQGTLLGHPKGLFVLFFTEMWERFSYYGMRALLVLYMVNYFKWTQQDASFIYKWYTSLVYLTPLLGGYLADRYLGNKRAIIIGASLMALGHFCMAFEQHTVFYAALVFLILGNGFFKPNMSTQVGRLYRTNDPRRDSAYTIFYMGINLGAFLSPLVCGWLRTHTRWEYHAGFAAAGVGMLIGLVTYLVGLRWVNEEPEDAEYEESDGATPEAQAEVDAQHCMTESEAATTPSVVGWISEAAPTLFTLLGLASVVGAVLLWWSGVLKGDNAVAFGLGGGFSAFMGAYILARVSMALRDRVLVIFIVGIFVACFWGAFEQAGNAMNVFADKTTDRYLTQEAPDPPIYPAVEGEGVAPDAGGQSILNPVSPEWFQSINALAIFVLAPVFAWLWLFLPKHGFDLSIPTKVGIGVFFQGIAFALMMWSVQYENQPSSAPLTALPPGVRVEPEDENRVVFRDAPNLEDEDAFAAFASADITGEDAKVVQGGRIRFDEENQKLLMRGVLSDTDRDRILRATVSADYLESVRELALRSSEEAEGEAFEVSVTLKETPPGFDLRYSGFLDRELRYNPDTRVLTTTVELADKDYKAILVAGADPAFHDAINKLYVASARFKVSPLWLFSFYILCTIGELCLSPVGLSMVSKLSPARFGTMLMGVWLMTSFFGNFIAGFAGENYGTVHPAKYFLYITIAIAIASFICFLFVKKMKAMMHGVK